MGVFDKFFKKNPSNDLIDDLAMRLNNEVEKWVQDVIPLLDSSKPVYSTSQIKFMLTGFQIVHVLAFIQMKGYVGQNIGSFSSDLCSRCCKNNYNQIKPYIEKFSQLNKNLSLPDQFKEITESIALDELKIGAVGLMKVGAFILVLYERSIFYAAYKFGDKETWEPLFRKFQKM